MQMTKKSKFSLVEVFELSKIWVQIIYKIIKFGNFKLLNHLWLNYQNFIFHCFDTFIHRMRLVSKTIDLDLDKLAYFGHLC